MRKSYFYIYFIVLLTVGLSSCVTTRKINYLQKPINFVPAYKDTVPYQEYKLKVGDKLFIQVYSTDEKTNALFNGVTGSGGMQAMSGEGEGQDLYCYTIQKNGAIQLPLVGDVFIENKTIRESKFILEDAIRPILKVNSVDVRTTGRFFSVIGSGKSGRFPINREKINIFQAVALAGDLGFYTDRTKIKILREGRTELISFDIRSVDIVHSEFYYIEPNDVIFLQPMKEQFLGVTTLWGAISTIMTTYAFAVIIQKSFFK